jgi:DNA-dependent RNA polymerase auxiliary subunit epsilon
VEVALECQRKWHDHVEMMSLKRFPWQVYFITLLGDETLNYQKENGLGFVSERVMTHSLNWQKKKEETMDLYYALRLEHLVHVCTTRVQHKMTI